MIKEINDPTLKVGDTVRFRVAKQLMSYQEEMGRYIYQKRDFIEGECTVIEIDNKKLIGGR